MSIYRFLELVIFVSYLILIFISIQIWFLWKNIDKNECKSQISEALIWKSYTYVFLSFTIFMIHEFIEDVYMFNRTIYEEFFEMLALMLLLLFAIEWYQLFKKCSKKSLPDELMKQGFE